jgi:hypothetical protein
VTGSAVHAGVDAVVVARAEGLGNVAVAAMVAAVAGSERSGRSESVMERVEQASTCAIL